jgi:hypothetical protein
MPFVGPYRDPVQLCLGKAFGPHRITKAIGASDDADLGLALRLQVFEYLLACHPVRMTDLIDPGLNRFSNLYSAA